MPPMYVAKYHGIYALRQTRYKEMLERGCAHPHDICAIARTLDELRNMCEALYPDTEFLEPDNHQR